MSNLTKIVIAGLVIAATAAGVVLIARPAAAPAPTQVSSATGPDIPSLYLQWGGLTTYNSRPGLLSASTTLCNIQSPSSTSTLVYAALRLDVGSTTAMDIDFGNSTAPDATTTVIGTSTVVPANTQISIVASTTPTAGAKTTFGPNTWLVVKAGLNTAAAVGTFSSTGFCSAQFIVN